MLQKYFFNKKFYKIYFQPIKTEIKEEVDSATPSKRKASSSHEKKKKKKKHQDDSEEESDYDPEDDYVPTVYFN